MFGIDNLKLSLSFNPVLFFITFALFAAFTFFTYKVTLPQISRTKKILLMGLRISALTLILFAVSEPVLTIVKKLSIQPKTFFFIDNSQSIKNNPKLRNDEKIRSFLENLKASDAAKNIQLKKFGAKISDLSFDSLDQVSSNENSTNFAKIFSSLSEIREDFSSAAIISDGIITDGSNPINEAEKNGVPVFTVGIGDTSTQNDVQIKNVLYNEFIYAETPTNFLTAILNEGFANQNTRLSLYENDSLIEQKELTLSKDGIQNITVSYNPKVSGEKKITLMLSPLKDEYSSANNRKVFYVNVLSNKIRVLLISGSPSADLSFVKNALAADNNLSVSSITQIGVNKFLERNNPQRLLDSADVLVLIGFPSKETSAELIKVIINLIAQKNLPYLFLLSGSCDLSKLNQFKMYLPFTASKPSNNYIQVQPNIINDQSQNPLIQHGGQDILALWNNLPPVDQPFAEFSAKPESEVVAQVKINNIVTSKPLILTRRLSSQRSIAILAKDIWKWKLQTALKNQNLFDRFILNCVKWLNSPEDKKQVRIKTVKKLFAVDEDIEFSAEVYDAAFNPVSDAEVKVKVLKDKNIHEIILSSIGNGLYEGVLQLQEPGNYSFLGEARLNNKLLGTDNGLLSVGEVNVEMVNQKMDLDFLKSLANVSGGKYYEFKNADELIKQLVELNNKISKEKVIIKEYSLWSHEALLAIIIVLFGAEWFLRKREGML